MPEFTLTAVLQIVVAVGLLNVWLIRAGSASDYRGRDARSLKEEFAAYGLPPVMFYIVGALKIGAAILLLVGLWVPAVVATAAAIVAVLMVGALAMHVKVGDPLKKSVPAFLMLLFSVGILFL